MKPSLTEDPLGYINARSALQENGCRLRIVGNVRAPLCTRCRSRDHNVRRCTEPAHLTAIVDVKAGPSTHHYTPRAHAHHAGNSKGERWGRVLAYMWLGV